MSNWLFNYGSQQVPKPVGQVDELEAQDSLVQRLVGSRPRKNHCFNLSPKAGKKLTSQFKDNQAEEFSLIGGRVRIFILFKPSID